MLFTQQITYVTIVINGGLQMRCKAIDCKTEAKFGILKLCNRHYQKFRNYGDENFKMVNDTNSGKINIIFGRKIEFLRKKYSSKECWIYPDKPMKNGYVTVCIYRKNGKQIRKLAHRLSYEFFIRKIPKGKVIDHTCRVRNCVNPNHLQVITFRKNILIGKGIPAINHAKKFCKNGHEFKKKNTFFI